MTCLVPKYLVQSCHPAGAQGGAAFRVAPGDAAFLRTTAQSFEMQVEVRLGDNWVLYRDPAGDPYHVGAPNQSLLIVEPGSYRLSPNDVDDFLGESEACEFITLDTVPAATAQVMLACCGSSDTGGGGGGDDTNTVTVVEPGDTTMLVDEVVDNELERGYEVRVRISDIADNQILVVTEPTVDGPSPGVYVLPTDLTGVNASITALTARVTALENAAPGGPDQPE